MDWKLNLFKIYTDESDIEAVLSVLKRGSYWATGPEIKRFEDDVARYLDSPYVLTFNSGTSALHAMLESYDVRGKEVILPSFTFIATANAVLLAGGIPVFAETESETFGLDAEDVKKKITNNTKSILSFHFGGFPSRDIEILHRLAQENNIILMEDAAQSFGSHMSGKKVGTFGESSIFSLCQNKILTTGEGGLLVTKSQQIYEKAKLLRSHGRVEEGEDYFASTGEHKYVQVGYNFRMPSMCAALGISQLKKVNEVIRRRRKRAEKITLGLSSIDQISLPGEITNHFPVYQMYTIWLNDKSQRADLQTHLKKASIMNKVYFDPIHLKTIYRNLGSNEGDLPQTEELAKHVLNIPLFPTMEDAEIKYMVAKIREFFDVR